MPDKSYERKNVFFLFIYFLFFMSQFKGGEGTVAGAGSSWLNCIFSQEAEREEGVYAGAQLPGLLSIQSVALAGWMVPSTTSLLQVISSNASTRTFVFSVSSLDTNLALVSFYIIGPFSLCCSSKEPSDASVQSTDVKQGKCFHQGHSLPCISNKILVVGLSSEQIMIPSIVTVTIMRLNL